MKKKRDKTALKIMHVIGTLDNGGAEHLLLSVCKGVKERIPGVSIRITVLFKAHSLLKSFTRAGIDVKCLELELNGALRKLVAVIAAIIAFRPHVVHTHLNHADRYGQIAAWITGVGSRISTMHNIQVNPPFQDRLTLRIMALLSTQIVAVSKSAERDCVKIKKIPKNKIIVIYNSSEYCAGPGAIPRRYPENDEKIRLLHVGRPDIRKGQVYAVRAMKSILVEFPLARLDLVGMDNGKYREGIEGEIKLLKLESVISLHETVSDPGGFLDKSDVFIASSITEGFHMAVVEAMSRGVPVAATDIFAHRELLLPVPGHVLVVPENSESLALGVCELLRNRERYEKLSCGEIERAQFFNMDKLKDGYERLYLDTIKATRGS